MDIKYNDIIVDIYRHLKNAQKIEIPIYWEIH